jgi:hypothetical protein
MGLKIIKFFKSQIFFSFIITLILISSFKNISAEYIVDDDIDCYGFIVPLPQGRDTTTETFERSKVTQLINDLLREEIDVYQSKEDFSANIKLIDENNVKELFFFKGAFIIPFSGDEYKDKLLTSIVYDYNQTHELNFENHIKSKVYVLIEELEGEYDRLVETKIVQHLGGSIRYGWPTYLEIADAGGFFTYECMLNNEASLYLDNDDCNILIWPYLPGQASLFEQLYTIIKIRDTNAVRRFVNNGGGYIGTCQGAFVASAGIRMPGILNSVRLAYQSHLSRLFPGISHAISDTIIWIPDKLKTDFFQATVEIIKPNHPLFYGLNNTFFDLIYGGLFGWIGKNTEALAVFKDIKTFNGDTIDDKDFKNLINGTSCWVNSKFGNGEVILFTSHPDFINNIRPLNNLGIKWVGDPYNGRKLIYNSFFYVTSEKNTELNLFFDYEESYINLIMDKTDNIIINDTSNNNFYEIINKLNELNYDLTNLNNKLTHINELYPAISEKIKKSPKAYSHYEYNLNYTCWLSDKFKNYINSSVTTLIKLDKIVPMFSEYNDSIVNKIDTLKSNLIQRLKKAKEIVTDVIVLSEKIGNILMSNRINIFQEISLIRYNKNLLKIFEIGLKYIPQLYFESQKILRNFWYNYEANIALENIVS